MKAALLLTLALASQAMAGRIAQEAELKVAAEEATNVVFPALITGMVVGKAKGMVVGKAKKEAGDRLKALVVDKYREDIANELEKVVTNIAKKLIANNGLQKVVINKLKNFAHNKIDEFRKGGPANDGAVDEDVKAELAVANTRIMELELENANLKELKEAEFQRQLKKSQDEMPKWRRHLSRAKHRAGDALNKAKPVVKKSAMRVKDRAGDTLNEAKKHAGDKFNEWRDGAGEVEIAEEPVEVEEADAEPSTVELTAEEH